MKHYILNIALAGCALVTVSSCSDYLETSSPSTVTEGIVMSSYDNCRSAMDGTYTALHDVLVGKIFGNGMFYAGDVAGSDIERHGGERAANRIPYETLYYGGNETTLATYNPATEFKESPDDGYSMLYAIISTANTIINGITDAQLSGDKAKEYKQVYGEAICMRATAYRELIKYYGDVCSIFTMKDDPTAVVSRLGIYDKIISDLQNVTSNNYLAPISATAKNRFSLQYAYALLGRIAMEAGSYQTYRTDITTSGLEKHPDYYDAHGATYARPSNYKAFYDIAYNAFKWVAEHQGAITFDENDYSKFFTQLHGADYTYADESIFEDEQVQGASGNCERSYSIGRPSGGGSKDAYPCKAYGQCRINVAFYYGKFDPRDTRRDIACVVTGSDGKGYEVVLPFTLGNTSKGAGIACGKFDENRQDKVWTKNQRRSGINAPYMRISEVYLGLAEAALMKTSPDQTTADTYYNKTHKRAGLGTKSGVTLEEVIDERGFEFAAEGDRRWTLIRTGFLGKKVKEIKELTKKMMDGLQNQGYYTFDNGNQISKYIYTKAVNPKDLGLSSRLTPATPTSMLVAAYDPDNDTDATKFPGWRGQHDWETISAFKAYDSKPNSNLAIRGLFKHLESAPAGYTKVKWGEDIVSTEDLRNFFGEEIFQGWDFKSAPIYLLPFTKNDRIGGITNGYGFMN